MWLVKLLAAVRGRLWKQPDQPAAQDNAASAQLKAIYEQRQRSDKARDSGAAPLMVQLLARHHAAIPSRGETTSAPDVGGKATAAKLGKRETNWPMLLLACTTALFLLKLFAWWFYK